jgi:hypothetical protein
MSVLQHHSKYPVQVTPVADNIAALQQHFGAPLVNKMLETAPTLVSRAAGNLLKNYEGLQAVLGGDDALTRAVVARSADVLTRAPDTLAQRPGEVQEILKVSVASKQQREEGLDWNEVASLRYRCWSCFSGSPHAAADLEPHTTCKAAIYHAHACAAM